MKRSEIFRFLVLRTIGNFLVLFAIFGILATFGPALYYEASFRVANIRGVRYIVEAAELIPTTIISPTPTPSSVGQPTPNVTTPTISPIPTPTPTPAPQAGVDNFLSVLTGPKEQILRPVDTQFGIIIPAIGASAKIFANIDAGDSNSFLPVLQKGVAHAKGTVFPGMKGNIYLFAHSTDNFWDVGRYNAIFYLLKDLQKGDEIVIFFEGKRHNYIVSGSKIVSPSDISYIVNARNQTQEQLILQTCWPPGTTFQRLLVFASPK